MNAISVANVAIRQFDNLYSLNDLHKASGGENRHKPSLWLQNQQTSDLIDEISKAGNPALDKNQQVIQVVKGGNKRGTYACKELVYAYATWISAKFFLQVIRTFDAVISGSLHSSEALPSAKTTADDRTGLRQAVAALVGRKGIDYSTAYGMIHQRFNVGAIEDLPAEKLPEAVAYVHALTLHTGLTGEVLDALPKAKPKLPINGNSLADIAAMVYYGTWMIELGKDVSAPLRQLGCKQAVTMWTVWHETRSRLKRAAAALEVFRKYADKDTSDRIAVCLEGIYSKAAPLLLDKSYSYHIQG